MSADRPVRPYEPAHYTPASTTALGSVHPAFAGGPVLLAVDRGARVRAVMVFDTRPQLIPPPLDRALALADRAGGSAMHSEERREIRAILAGALGRPVEWPVEVLLGTPAPTIVEEAERVGASLIVMSLRPHSAIDRALNDETTINVMRRATCPVLGLTAWTTVPPKRVLVGIDFGRASLRAARLALAMIAEGGTLVLAYAPPPEMPDVQDDGEHVVHEMGVETAWRWLDNELAPGADVTIEHVVLRHRPDRTVADLLFAHADEHGADMIALGSRRHGRVERWLLGSVTTDMARDGAYALLVVPPEDA